MDQLTAAAASKAGRRVRWAGVRQMMIFAMLLLAPVLMVGIPVLAHAAARTTSTWSIPSLAVRSS